MDDIAMAAADQPPARRYLSVIPAGLEKSKFGMSNFDHAVIDDGMEEALRSGALCSHYAANFHGVVWFADGMFHEEVSHYRVPQEVISAATLAGLMDAVNEKWGAE